MPGSFQYDVFLCHSAKDKAVLCPLAERLRKDGLKVWFDEWEIPVAVSRQIVSQGVTGRTGIDVSIRRKVLVKTGGSV